MDALSLEIVTDPASLADLYRDPYIARVGHDHRPAAPIIHPAVTYFGAHVNGRFVGAFMRIDSNFIDVDVHALLTRRALPWSRDLGRLFLAAVFSDQAIQRATAQIIEGLEAARNYCLRLGFKREGFKRQACLRNGALVGVHILGMTRADWEDSK